MTLKPLGIYVHIPFCRGKCLYCAFNSVAFEDFSAEEWVSLLSDEFFSHLRGTAFKGVNHRLRSIYFGGGTPSLLPPSAIKALAALFKKKFSISEDLEITLEANPEGLGLVELKGFLEAGVNRLSIGVQSLDAGELRTLGRRHGPGEALTAARNARLAGFKNVSLDLIYGLPGQTSLSWSATLEGVLALSSDHISLYNLSIEDNTPFSKLYGGQGERPFMDEDLERSMYEDAIAKLFSKGYEHYEISNFAMPGFKSAHNEGYWMGRDYMGLGPGAHSFLNDSAYGPWGRRSWNEADIESYKRALGEGSPLAGFELLSREEAMEEAVLLGLRMLDRGLDLNSYERAFGREAREKLLVKCIGLEADGLLHIQGNKASLDKSALFISNEVCLGLVS